VKLKKRSQPLVDVTNQQKPSPSQPSVVEMKKVDPHIRELLKVPVCSVPAKKTTRGTAHIPKHRSGKEMIRLLEEKKMKKDQEAAEKAKRKAEREEKKRRKEEEKLQKEKRKQEKVTRKKKYTAKIQPHLQQCPPKKWPQAPKQFALCVMECTRRKEKIVNAG